jgi:hypothetical protein
MTVNVSDGYRHFYLGGDWLLADPSIFVPTYILTGIVDDTSINFKLFLK